MLLVLYYFMSINRKTIHIVVFKHYIFIERYYKMLKKISNY